jgi:hypothetical protein
MGDEERPQLHPRIYEQVEQLMYRLDGLYWRELADMQIPAARLHSQPDPPKLPLMLQGIIEQYASALFRVEAEQYEQIASSPYLMAWLSRLADRVQLRVIAAFDRIEKVAMPERSFEYHGLNRTEMIESLRTSLWHAGNRVAQNFAEKASAQATARVVPTQAVVVPPKRRSSMVTSASAVEKMERYIRARALDYADFAASAGTTDKTLRSFRNTKSVRRSIFYGIAKAMNVSVEELLKD